MVVIDIETSGLDPERCSLLAIGALDFSNPKDQFYGECRVPGGMEVSDDSLNVAGFSIDQIYDSNKLLPEDLVIMFIDWLKNKENQTIAGHNVHWDVEFLRKECKRSNISHKFGHRIVDLHSVAYCKYLVLDRAIPLHDNRTDLDLDEILHFVGIPKRSGSHHALEDAKLEAECFGRILWGKSMFDEFRSYSIPNYLIYQKPK